MKALLLIVGFVLFALATPSAANPSASEVEQELNRSELCATLPDLDIRDVAELLGIDLPIPPFFNLDLTARWDKNKHAIKNFAIDDHRFRVTMTLGCEPSGSSAVISALPISAQDVRLEDNASCEGSFRRGGSVSSIECTVSGEIGDLIARYADLDGYVSASLNTE